MSRIIGLDENILILALRLFLRHVLELVRPFVKIICAYQCAENKQIFKLLLRSPNRELLSDPSKMPGPIDLFTAPPTASQPLNLSA